MDDMSCLQKFPYYVFSFVILIKKQPYDNELEIFDISNM